MNVIGFLTIHDPHIPCSNDINSLCSGQFENDELPGIIAYLNNGVAVIKYISSIYDDSGELIGPNVIYTDGLWVWPSYYSYYLKKYPQMLVPEAFKMWIKSNKQKGISLNQNEKIYIEYMVSKMCGVRIPNGLDLSNINKMIARKGDYISCF